MANHTRIGVQDVARHFEGLEDPRSEINQRHPLVSVVVIALMSVLAGASGPTAIAAWASDKKDFLLTLLPLPNGIPKKDVYRRVLSASNNPCLRLTERRCGAATIATRAWVHCIRSAFGRPSSA